MAVVKASESGEPLRVGAIRAHLPLAELNRCHVVPSAPKVHPRKDHIKIAENYLKERDLRLLVSDKQGGFVVMTSGTFGVKAAQALDKNFIQVKKAALRWRRLVCSGALQTTLRDQMRTEIGGSLEAFEGSIALEDTDKEDNDTRPHPQPLDMERVHEAMELLSGEHDFRSFKGVSRSTAEEERSTVREVTDFRLRPAAPLDSDDPLYENVQLWEFHIRSKSFLYRQVRLLPDSKLF
ncbi:hypothetical protein HPB50_006299 [Hyalomma asiaticum]|uniref:Uncharacterized protein n=1 Tax=Hyalomma asiaticum TaxID=266040 RepID=A0ACB7SCQ0_HYAAI|nr:hypothetical protein HPB50_006299 [Hyalomma asiaticum]